MVRFLNWIVERIIFFLKFALFLSVFAILGIYGTIHAAIYGGQIMSDDAWFLAKILFLLLAPGFVAFAVTRKRGAVAFTGVLILGYVASLLLACSPVFSWGNYTHAPSFRPPTYYTVENGKLVIPEDKRADLLRDCGHITNEGLQYSCQTVVYCQDWSPIMYERAGCEELLMKKSSPALLDIALIEWRGYEYEHR